MKLTGLVCVRNGNLLDYCWRETVASLLPVCDSVLICDSDSTDGTAEAILGWESVEPKIRAINYPWPNPHQNDKWWVQWLNWARGHVKTELVLQLDADEVISPSSYQQIEILKQSGEAALFRRFNFWKDASHLAPENRCCGTMVARMGPAHFYLPSDEPNPAVNPNLRTFAQVQPSLDIFHYGFIRDPKAFVKKSVVVQNAFFGSVDSRITDMADAGKDWRERNYFDDAELQPYVGRHPPVAIEWLRARGYQVS